MQSRGVEGGYRSAFSKNLSRQEFLRMGVGLTGLALPGLAGLSCRETSGEYGHTRRQAGHKTGQRGQAEPREPREGPRPFRHTRRLSGRRLPRR